MYEGPNGEVYEDLQEAYEQEVAARSAQTSLDENKLALTFLQKFLNEAAGARHQRWWFCGGGGGVTEPPVLSATRLWSNEPFASADLP